MNDPCVACLVTACCSRSCKEKEEYMHQCICNLTVFIDTHLQNGSHKSDPSLSQEHVRLLQICEKNQGDFQKIYQRAVK